MACKTSIDNFDDEQLASIEKELTLPLRKTGIQQKFVYPFNLIDRQVYLPLSYATIEWGIQRPPRELFSQMSVKFEGKLREEQIKVKNDAISCLNKTGSTLMSMYCGFGKCLGFNTPVLCFNGTIKKVQHIVTGDKLMGDDGMVRNVLSLARGKEQMYRIDIFYGQPFTANQSHILSLCAISHRKKVKFPNDTLIHVIYFDKNVMDYRFMPFIDEFEADHFLSMLDSNPIVDISIEEYLGLSYYTRSNLFSYRIPVKFGHRNIHIDPYFLGLWLGIGNETTGEFRTSNELFIRHVTKCLAMSEIELIEKRDIDMGNGEIRKQTYVRMAKTGATLNGAMNRLGLLTRKKIPNDYLINTREVRLAVLAGLIDSCGRVNCENMCYITVKSIRLCEDILYLTHSLGFNSLAYDSYRNGKFYHTIVMVTTTGPEIPVLLQENRSEYKHNENSISISQISVTPISETDYYGFEIDGNHRFLLGDFTVTHNTITSINLACSIGLKTMIVMNRVVLMNQWEKSIKSVCPNSVIQKINLKEKRKDADFYIINAINMPKIGNEWFDDIGTAIIDECFTYNTLLITPYGLVKIGDMWSSPSHVHRVLSFNEREKIFEYKTVTNAFKKDVTKRLVTVKFSDSTKIECTEDHMFLTLFGGYKSAKDLENNVAIVATCDKMEFSGADMVSVLDTDRQQIVFGCFLAKTMSVIACDGHYIVNFKTKQPFGCFETEYIAMKNDMFRVSGMKVMFDDGKRYLDEDFPDMMNKFDAKGLAVWYMESFSYCHDRDIILVCRPDLKQHLVLILNFFRKHDINVHPQVFENVIFIVVSNKNVLRFMTIIHPHVWSYSLCEITQPFVHGCLRVESVSNYSGPKQKYVYDIEVEDNHNFVVCGDQCHLGGVVVHNCHTIVAETLSKSLLRLTPRYLIGLSATPYRPDEMDSLISLYFGDNKIVRELFKRHTVFVVNTKFKPEMKYMSNGKINWGSVLDSQATNKKRNDLIIHIVVTNADRNFLLLTKRVEQARYLIKNLTEKGESVTNLVGSKQEYDPTARILVATIQKVSCGFDHSKLDTLLLAADTEEYYTQVLGRIFRTQDTEPIVFDLVDDNPILKRHFEMRREVYRKHGGLLQHIEY